MSQAPKHRNLNPSGLGRAIINQKVKDARQMQESGLVSTTTSSDGTFLSFTL
jgi:large subunit GTPase 1